MLLTSEVATEGREAHESGYKHAWIYAFSASAALSASEKSSPVKPESSIS
jgi:hypothetical protein